MQEAHPELGCDTAAPCSGYKVSSPKWPCLPDKSLSGHTSRDTQFTPIEKLRRRGPAFTGEKETEQD